MKNLYYLLLIMIVFTACKEAPKTIAKSPKKEVVVEFTPKKVDTSGMIHFEGGTILFGSNDGLPNEKPTFEKKIEPFYLDKNLVTVAEFRKFVEATAYKTEADKFGDSGVFLFETGNWTLLKGANWEYPLGREKPKSLDNHPVTHVSWNDAKAYAGWIGKRLPTEFEWEFAAKNGKNKSDKYSWGPDLIVKGKYMANVWQGASVQDETILDGYLLTSPIGVFGENSSGLTDMGGNVWQWCENYFKPYPDNENSSPQDPKIRTTRGGSFMFDAALEKSYTTTFRGQNSVDTSLFNTGFRCAK